MSSRAILQSVNIVTPWYVAMLQCSIIIHDLIGANCLLVWGWPLTPVAKPDDVVNSCKEVRGGDSFISVLETEFLKLPFLWSYQRWYQIEERQRRRRSLNCVSFLSSYLKIVFPLLLWPHLFHFHECLMILRGNFLILEKTGKYPTSDASKHSKTRISFSWDYLSLLLTNTMLLFSSDFDSLSLTYNL